MIGPGAGAAYNVDRLRNTCLLSLNQFITRNYNNSVNLPIPTFKRSSIFELRHCQENGKKFLNACFVANSASCVNLLEELKDLPRSLRYSISCFSLQSLKEK
jgi:hypothetical protein